MMTHQCSCYLHYEYACHVSTKNGYGFHKYCLDLSAAQEVQEADLGGMAAVTARQLE